MPGRSSGGDGGCAPPGAADGADPPAASPRDRLGAARLYVCAPPTPAVVLAGLARAGVDVLQLRDKDSEAQPQLAAALAFHEAGALFVLNDRADLAVVAGADGVHVGQGDLTPAQARSVVGPDLIVGRSTHSLEEALAAMDDPDVDYFCCGPCWATPTKPGRPAAGLGLVRAVAARVSAKPWFAIGGIDLGNLTEVLDAGATRVVVVRAILDAPDPAAAAAELAAVLGAPASGGSS